MKRSIHSSAPNEKSGELSANPTQTSAVSLDDADSVHAADPQMTRISLDPHEAPTSFDGTDDRASMDETNGGCAIEPTPETRGRANELVAKANPTSQASSTAKFRDLLTSDSAGQADLLGHFRIGRLAGEGGMGLVYVAEDLHLHRQVALKIMRPEAAIHAEGAARFVREARAMASVKHDNVVTIYHVGEDRGVPYLSMELLDGMSLAKRLKIGPPMRLPEIVRIGREIASGLAAAHANGLIHRDIKPGNIWLESPSGRVKILDFGMAKPPQTKGEQLTHYDALVGTPGFMAPEQVWGTAIDPRADLFGLGCVLYRMVTGRFPFNGDNMLAKLSAMTNDTPIAVATLNPASPPLLAELIAELMQKEAKSRPASAQIVCERLLQIERECFGQSSTMEHSSRTPLVAADTKISRGFSRPSAATVSDRWPQKLARAANLQTTSEAVPASKLADAKPDIVRLLRPRLLLLLGILAVVCATALVPEISQNRQKTDGQPKNSGKSLAPMASRESVQAQLNEDAHGLPVSSKSVQPAAPIKVGADIEYRAMVDAVANGDTLSVVRTFGDGSKADVNVRLDGIAAPEYRQAFYAQASARLAQLCLGKNVTVRPLKNGAANRVIAILTLDDGTNVNQEMVRGGYAWWDRVYMEDKTLELLEKEARAAGRGLWINSDAVSPWQWRAQTAELRKSKRSSKPKTQ